MSTSLTFRCPDDLAAFIKSQTESTNQDKTSVVVSLLRAGIQALNNGAVEIPISNLERKTQCKAIDPTEVETIVEARLASAMAVLQAQLLERIDEVEDRLEERLGKLKARLVMK